MKIEIFADADTVAKQAAAILAGEARAAVARRGRFVFAVSGGHTPWVMLRAFAEEVVPWDKVHLVQVDERVAPAGDPDRNRTHLRESLLDHAPLPPEQVHAMPVELTDLEEAARQYRRHARKDRRHAAGARSCPPRPRTGRAHGFPGARRPGPPGQRRGRRRDRNLSGSASDHPDLSAHQSCSTHPLAGDRE